MKKQLLILFVFISVLALSQVPQRFNKVVVTGDITSPKFIKTGSTADSVLLGNGSARAISAIKTDTVSLSNRINAKATGNGTANGTNTGDETLTSIKTKLGAASAVSDGYLKYQDWNTFNSKEPAITKNTAFNKNFGTTTGTVLEGRTFGTAAGSAVGDFQPAITGLSTNYLPKWNGSSFVNSLISDDGANAKVQTQYNIASGLRVGFSSGVGANFLYNNAGNTTTSFTSEYVSNSALMNFIMQTAGTPVTALSILGSGVVSIPSTTPSTLPTTGALVVNGGIGADHVRANNFYGNGSNLTGVQLPITLTTNGTSGAATFSGNVLNVPNYGSGATSGTYVPALTNYSNIASSSAFEAMYMHIGNMYSLSIKAAITPSTAGSCTLRITLPQQSNNKTGVFSVTSISNDQSTVLPSFTYTVGGADYVGVVVNVPSTASITLTVTGMYTHQ